MKKPVCVQVVQVLLAWNIVGAVGGQVRQFVSEPVHVAQLESQKSQVYEGVTYLLMGQV